MHSVILILAKCIEEIVYFLCYMHIYDIFYSWNMWKRELVHNWHIETLVNLIVKISRRMTGCVGPILVVGPKLSVWSHLEEEDSILF